MFLLIVAGLLYYVSTRALDVRLGNGDAPPGPLKMVRTSSQSSDWPGEGAEGADGSG